MKDIQRILSEAVSLLPVEAQQQHREDIKAGRLTPQLVAALIAKLELLISETKGKADESPMLAKVDFVSATLRGLDQRIKESWDSRGAQGDNNHDKLLSRMECLRGDMRKMEDDLAALAPYQQWKVLFLMGLALVLGGLVGWYGHIGYKSIQVQHHFVETDHE